jgi:hypothetical protein
MTRSASNIAKGQTAVRKGDVRVNKEDYNDEEVGKKEEDTDNSSQEQSSDEDNDNDEKRDKDEDSDDLYEMQKIPKKTGGRSSGKKGGSKKKGGTAKVKKYTGGVNPRQSKWQRKEKENEQRKEKEDTDQAEEEEENILTLFVSYGAILVKGIYYAAKSKGINSPTTHLNETYKLKLPFEPAHFELNLEDILAKAPFHMEYDPEIHVMSLMTVDTKIIKGSTMHKCKAFDTNITSPGERHLVIHESELGGRKVAANADVGADGNEEIGREIEGDEEGEGKEREEVTLIQYSAHSFE